MWVTELFAGATAFFACLMCLIVYYQVKTTKRLERAWVVVEDIAFDAQWNERQHFRPILKNVGRTVARIQKISLGGTKPRQRNEPLDPGPRYEGGSDLDLILAPGEQLPLLSIPEVPMNRENADSIRHGLLKCYIYGLVVYRDFEGCERRTAFCWKFYPGQLGETGRFYPFLEAPRGYTGAT